MKLRLGTRKSLLAVAQSSWVARNLEQRNAGLTVELVGIETTGDRVTDIPLSQIDGKEFFVAELDEALRTGKVDFNVHSMKDLSLDRPKEFTLGAIPPRENPRDVVFFHDRVFKKILDGEKILIGTSSPRRLENIPSLLLEILPQLGGRRAELKFLEIRGNVNTRLSRLQESADSGRQLDGVVLAAAGIARLYQDEQGREALKKLFVNTRKMVLPLKENPTAPAQGALAVECRASDEKVLRILRTMHDAQTEKNVAEERKVLADWGGGCHQRFGASFEMHPICGGILYTRGELPNLKKIAEMKWNAPLKARVFEKTWNGRRWRNQVKDAAASPKFDSLQSPLTKPALVFISHSRAWIWDVHAESLQKSSLWTSGIESWKRLAAKGLWVDGCFEELGFEAFSRVLDAEWLNYPAERLVLTHAKAAEFWRNNGGWSVVATYEAPSKPEDYSPEAIEALKEADSVFWTSASQYLALKDKVKTKPLVAHACGAGKSSEELKELLGDSLKIFPSETAWKEWVR